ncbi:hypothetical protein TNIN_412141 [Trichonephila inaurata madagascariensis]|uniref:Uncharacterized protein n=1 Tax=Trichonephila inaurata madagascariensis TaxID=2747483 RepID=A0A8X6J442_9ARAC|nr:hypothetical protein TNIN_412141 [Trichonephila inaurata madagascariensis]
MNLRWDNVKFMAELQHRVSGVLLESSGLKHTFLILKLMQPPKLCLIFPNSSWGHHKVIRCTRSLYPRGHLLGILESGSFSTHWHKSTLSLKRDSPRRIQDIEIDVPLLPQTSAVYFIWYLIRGLVDSEIVKIVYPGRISSVSLEYIIGLSIPEIYPRDWTVKEKKKSKRDWVTNKSDCQEDSGSYQ